MWRPRQEAKKQDSDSKLPADINAIRPAPADGNADGNADTWTGNKDYNVARTPYIQSQPIDGAAHVLHGAANVNNLFRVYTRSHGTAANTQYRIHILNVKRQIYELSML